MLLGVVVQSLKLVQLLGQQLVGNISFRSMIAEGECNKVGYLCTALPTLLGPRTCQDGCDNLMAAS